MRDIEIISKLQNGARKDSDLILTNETTKESVSWWDRVVALEKELRALSKEMFTLENNIVHMSQDIETSTQYKDLLATKRAKLESLVRQHPMWNHWLMNIPGVDATFAGYLLGFIDWSKDITGILYYCGLMNGGSSKRNAILYKKICNASGYFVSKSSPWSIYYYEGLIRERKSWEGYDYEKIKGKYINVEKKKMMIRFLTDFWDIYHTVIWSESLNLDSMESNPYVSVNLVDRYDFVNLPYYPRLGMSVDTRAHLYRVSLKYKKRLTRYSNMYNTLCKQG